MIRIFNLALLVLTVVTSARAADVQTSDHFDGKKFFNPGLDWNQTPWQTMRVMFAMAQSESWIEKPPVEVQAVLPEQPKSDEVTVTFVNHATFILQSRDHVILTDPVWSNRASPFSWVGPARYVNPGIKLSSLRKVDVVILSHNHYDHMDLDTLVELKNKFDPVFLVPLNDKKHLEAVGITKVHELDWWQEAPLKSGPKITFTPSQHFSARGLFDRNHSLWGSYMVELGKKRIYFGGDTGYSPHFKRIRERLGEPDVALLPIGAYEPYWFMKPIHMNPDDAVLAHLDLGSKKSIGMHFGTFKLTTEAIDQPEKDLKLCLQARGVEAKSFVVPVEGNTETFR